MNIKPLKKSILKETMIFGGIAMLMAAVLFFINMMHDDFTQKKNTLQGEANRLSGEKQQVENSLLNVQQNSHILTEASARTANPGMYIERNAVRDIFNIYRSQYYLKKLTVDMQPVVEVTSDPKFKRKTLIGIQSEVKISFEAVSDEDVYQMIRALFKELPGFTKMTSFEMKRMANISNQTVIDIRSQGSAALVSGSVGFTWYGIKSPDPNSAANKYIINKPEPRRRRQR